MTEAERDQVKHGTSLLRSLAQRIERAESAREAEAIMREAVESVQRMQERMYRARLTSNPFDVMAEAAKAKQEGRDSL